MHCIALSTLLLLAAAHVVLAIDPGTARGTLTVGTDVIALTHSHAFHDDNKAGLLPGPELRIVITDRDLPPELFPEVRMARLDRLVRTGKLRGVLLLVDPRQLTGAVRGRLLYPPSAPGAALVSFTLGGQDSPFSRLQMSNLRVVGVAQQRWSALPSMSFAYAVSFSAPRFRYDHVIARLTGPRAIKSAPAQSWLAFVRACREGDWHTAQALVTPGRLQEFETLPNQGGEIAGCQQRLHDMPAPAEHQQQLQQVLVRGVWALIILHDKTAISLQQRAGVWQVD